MNCKECIALVEGYFDGELDEQTTRLVAKHLQGCERCAAAHQRLEHEQELFLAYECDAHASNGFWDHVMARTAAPSERFIGRPGFRVWLDNVLKDFRGWRVSPLATAIIVVIAIGITVAVMRLSGSSERSSVTAANPKSESVSDVPPSKTIVEGPGADSGGIHDTAKPNDQVKEKASHVVNAGDRRDRIALPLKGVKRSVIPPNANDYTRTLRPEDLVREAERKYIEAISMLSRDVSRRSRLDPETAARFEQTLTAVDRTIADTRRAVRRNPGDPLAAKYMLTAYSKKIDVLRAMIGY